MFPPRFVGFRAAGSKPQRKPMTRQEHLDIIQKFKDSQAELERICKEKGWEVPVMVCKVVA